MYDKDDPRSEIVKLLPFFAGIIKSALNRKNHEIPSVLGLVITDAEGQKVPIDVSLDFRDERNLHVFDQMVMPMVISMVTAAEAHEMTAFLKLFQEPSLARALENGVAFSACPYEFVELNPLEPRGGHDCVVLPFTKPGPG